MTAARQVLDYLDDAERLHDEAYIEGVKDAYRSCATAIPELRAKGRSLNNILASLARMADRL